ncbi:hypothetical protein FKM82_022316 [Ascaphus truei]
MQCGIGVSINSQAQQQAGKIKDFFFVCLPLKLPACINRSSPHLFSPQSFDTQERHRKGTGMCRQIEKEKKRETRIRKLK